MTNISHLKRDPGRGSRSGRGARVGRRRASGARRRASADNHATWIERRIPHFEVLDTEALELIEHNAETVLQEIGVEFREFPSALELWKSAGADVDGERVRFPRGLCRSLVEANAPREYTQHARNPRRSTIVGGGRTVLAPAYGPPFRARPRQGTPLRHPRGLSQLRETHLHGAGLHHSGGTVCEPVDVPSTSATSTWCTAISSTRTSRSWVRSPIPTAPKTR